MLQNRVFRIFGLWRRVSSQFLWLSGDGIEKELNRERSEIFSLSPCLCLTISRGEGGRSETWLILLLCCKIEFEIFNYIVHLRSRITQSQLIAIFFRSNGSNVSHKYPVSWKINIILSALNNSVGAIEINLKLQPNLIFMRSNQSQHLLVMKFFSLITMFNSLKPSVVSW